MATDDLITVPTGNAALRVLSRSQEQLQKDRAATLANIAEQEAELKRLKTALDRIDSQAAEIRAAAALIEAQAIQGDADGQ